MSGFAAYESYDALGLAALVKAGEVSATAATAAPQRSECHRDGGP